MTIPIAALMAASCSVLVSLPALRVSGDYLMIASLGFQLGLIEMIKNVAASGGSGGLSGIPPLIPGNVAHLTYAILVIVSAAAIVWLIRRIMRSDYGRAVTALRDDEIAAAMLGRDPVWIKVWVIDVDIPRKRIALSAKGKGVPGTGGMGGGGNPGERRGPSSGPRPSSRPQFTSNPFGGL